MKRVLFGFALFLIAVPAAAKDHKPPVIAQGPSELEMRNLIPAGANPADRISRGEFVSTIVSVVYPKDLDVRCFDQLGSSPEIKYTKLFADVEATADNTALCVGLKNGIIRGLRDGNFNEHAALRASEAAYIVYKAYGIGPLDRQNKPGTPWYDHFLYDVDKAGGLPRPLRDPNHMVTWAEVNTMLFMLKKREEELNIPKSSSVKTEEKNERIRLMGMEQEFRAPTTLNADRVVVRVNGQDLVVPRPVRRHY